MPKVQEYFYQEKVKKNILFKYAIKKKIAKVR